MTQDDLNTIILLANHGVARLTASANGAFAEIQTQINTTNLLAAQAAEAEVKGAVDPAPELEAPADEPGQLERTQGA